MNNYLNEIVNAYKLNYVPSDPKLSILVKEHALTTILKNLIIITQNCS